jgi:hypothetical protein
MSNVDMLHRKYIVENLYVSHGNYTDAISAMETTDAISAMKITAPVFAVTDAISA